MACVWAPLLIGIVPELTAKSMRKRREGDSGLPRKGEYSFRQVRADASCMATVGVNLLFHAR